MKKALEDFLKEIQKKNLKEYMVEFLKEYLEEDDFFLKKSVEEFSNCYRRILGVVFEEVLRTFSMEDTR